jgi:hypothetical protein
VVLRVLANVLVLKELWTLQGTGATCHGVIDFGIWLPYGRGIDQEQAVKWVAGAGQTCLPRHGIGLAHHLCWYCGRVSLSHAQRCAPSEGTQECSAFQGI